MPPFLATFGKQYARAQTTPIPIKSHWWRIRLAMRFRTRCHRGRAVSGAVPIFVWVCLVQGRGHRYCTLVDSLASIRRVDLVGVCRGYVGVFENCVIGVSPTPRSDSAYRNHIICVKLYFVLCTLYYHNVRSTLQYN